MLSTYIGYSEEVIIVFALVFCIMRKRLNIGFINRNLMFIIFFTYCFFDFNWFNYRICRNKIYF